MKNIPTAAQFLNQDQELILDIIDGKFSYSIALDILQNKLIEFTKIHIEAALIAKVDAMMKESYEDSSYSIEELDAFTQYCYPQENIK
jgi:hypothetical protein